MAYIKKFIIKNFKGIETLELNIGARHKSPVITLVGLNESGKTTILEALSHFVTYESTISEERAEISAQMALLLVPIARKANFTGEIEVSAEVVLEETDVRAVAEIFDSEKCVLETTALPSTFDIKRTYSFADGVYEKTRNTWFLEFQSRTRKQRKFRQYWRPSEEQRKAGAPDLWLASVNAIKETLPLIAYFPTFLVDIPDRIYLVQHTDEHPSQRYYRDVLQDALDSLEEDLSLEKHVVQRIAEYQTSDSSPNWISGFFARGEKRQVDSVIQKISSAISREVIGSWKNIFSRPISAKMITLDWNIDTERGGIPYVSVGISDGESIYALHERSLGFRWFFLFLLFTRFKRNSNRPLLFLFDEPAANLHARAQTELLKSFDKIIENRNEIIYSTHSPYMINPAWIPAAHIVENKAINYDSNEDMLTFISTPTSISAVPYRQFVSENSNRTSYYQPILEKLDYVQPEISPSGPVLVTEGISDFHAFKFYCGELLEEAGVSLMPGIGDTNHDVVISTLISTGKKFIVVLDDDSSGRRGAERYRQRWLLDDQCVATVGELSSEFSGRKLETLLSADTLDNIANHFAAQRSPTKKQIGMYFAEAHAGLVAEASAETSATMKKIVSEAIKRL